MTSMADTKSKKLSGFIYLNITQFLGSLNDNLYKFLLIYFLMDLQGTSKSPTILALAGAIFVIPFLLFSIPSGTLADRISKSKIIVFTKFIEIATVILGVIGFALESPFLVYSGLFLLATESAIFGPSKYGIIPEIVHRDEIAKSNGYLSSFTFLAIIVGTFLGSFLTQITHRNFLLASFFCLLVAIVGIFASYKIPLTPPMGSTKRIDPFFLREILPTLRKANETEHLLPAILGSGFFLFIGAFTQLNIIPYSIQCLGLTDVEGGYLFLVTALGIGGGSLIAGKISGKFVELGLVPIGGLGITLCFFILGYCADNLVVSVIAVFLLGVFGGIFLVPCDSFIQYASPNHLRGQNVATNNFGGFVGVFIASGLIYLLSNLLGLSASRGFIFFGIMTLFVTLLFLNCLRQPVLRFFAIITGKKDLEFKGEELIPGKGAALLLAEDWATARMILSYRNRYIHLSKDCSMKNKWKIFLYRAIKLITISTVNGQEPPQCFAPLKQELKKGKICCLICPQAASNPALKSALLQFCQHSEAVFLNLKKQTDQQLEIQLVE